ncbi:glycosyltransferase [Pontiellaceae bacterium B12227]|nr:glycosyltransferase [Pontiellaceae bacterium B12227]
MLDKITIADVSENYGRLTVVIPVRFTHDRADMLERLSYIEEDHKIPREVNIMVVDDGSPKRLAAQIRSHCLDHGYSYIHINSEYHPFSIARARNVGASYARSDYVMFQDVDLMPYDGFYHAVLKEIRVQGLDENGQKFLMFGVIYLTRKATAEYLTSDRDIRKETFVQHLFDTRNDLIEKVSTGTSVIAINREYYLARGGNDEDFQEWGYDDIEFNCRCIRKVRKFPLPDEFRLDYKNCASITEYKGWKSIYRLFGDMTFQKGIMLFHAWHEVDSNSDYQKGRVVNERLFNKKMLDFATKGIEPPPLHSEMEGSTLVFSETNPFIQSREFLPRLGKVFVEKEEDFSAKSLLRYIKDNGISRVLMHNPYATSKRMSFYRALRRRKIPYLIAERGALRDSVFFDPNGFNADSASYDAKLWDKPLTQAEEQSVEEYIRKEIAEDSSLEAQGARQGSAKIRKKLGIRPNQKILFVPLQRPSDTVIKYMCGPIETHDRFIELVGETATALGDEWVVVVKKHPLEDLTPEIENAVFDNDGHVKDLMEACDAMLLINSGVGCLGMIWGKPVYHAGSAFYSHPAINRQVTTAEEILDGIRSGFKPRRETVYRFISYLINDFYSFGTFTTREAKWEGDSRMTVTMAIDFYQIRGLGQTRFNSRTEPGVITNRDSILMDRYRYAMSAKPEPRAPQKRQPVKKESPATASHVEVETLSRREKLRLKKEQNPRKYYADSKFFLARLYGKIAF